MKKKLVSLLALGLFTAGVTGCTKGGNSSSNPGSNPSSNPSGNSLDIAMISDVGTIDDGGFNQYTWEGVKRVGKDLGKSTGYIVPKDDKDDERKASIDGMLKRGAKAVVLTGYKFNDLVGEYAKKNPNVAWFLIDGSASTAENLENVYSVEFKEQEAGYLAGYAVVKEGYKNLAFLGGMAVPAVERFGFGYLSGICDAAEELAKTTPATQIKVKYGYTGDFGPSESNLSNSKVWYTSGVEAIFACGGAICKSVEAAAKSIGANKAKIIGVDVNQHPQQPDLYITSAEKKVEKTTYDAIKLYFDSNKDLTGKWPAAQAGKHEILGAKQGKIGLPTDTDAAGDPWTFKKFTKEQYNTLYQKLVAEETDTKVVSDNDGKTRVSGALNNDHVQITFESVGQNVLNKPTLKNAA